LLYFLHLTKDERDLFEPTTPLFGSKVEEKLGEVSFDIAESGKCLAIERSTASVFHLMRIMEVGVQKFGDKLGISLTEEKVWQVILDGVNKHIKTLPQKHELTKRYASVSAHLYNVKLAWRNETMHPNAIYDHEQALGIFSAVRRFMIDLVGVL